MVDRSSRPHTHPNRTAQHLVKKIVHLRIRKRLGPVKLAGRLEMASSTVHAVLKHCRLNQLSHIDVQTGEPARRYERETPGARPHVDVKKLGNISEGGGWRYVGRFQGDRNRAVTAKRTGSEASPALRSHRRRRPLPRRLRRDPRRRARRDRDRRPATGRVLVRRPRRPCRTGPLRQRPRVPLPRLATRLRRRRTGRSSDSIAPWPTAGPT